MVWRHMFKINRHKICIMWFSVNNSIVNTDIAGITLTVRTSEYKAGLRHLGITFDCSLLLKHLTEQIYKCGLEA